MNIAELYKERFVLSFEVFPPKTPQGEANLMSALAELSRFKPGFVSVTYGAGGSTREKTVELSLAVRERFGIMPLMHFTCVGAGREEITRYLDQVRAKGLANILALRGDPPQGETGFTPPADGFRYANELVSFIRLAGGFTIGVAGYPEGHIEAPDLETDLANLRRKVDAGADFVLSQLFFDNEDFFRFEERARAMGVTVPLVPGIMPVTNLSQIQRITTMCGARIPEELMTRLKSCESAESICRAGIEYSIRQCRELVAHGVPGVHLYPLNRADVAKIIIEEAGLSR
jgi:methylenetetrahydrofolate reductase (NADPH)